MMTDDARNVVDTDGGKKVQAGETRHLPPIKVKITPPPVKSPKKTNE